MLIDHCLLTPRKLYTQDDGHKMDVSLDIHMSQHSKCCRSWLKEIIFFARLEWGEYDVIVYNKCMFGISNFILYLSNCLKHTEF